MPHGATVATSTVGVVRDEGSAKTWREGMARALDVVKPKRLLLYGGGLDFDFGGAEVVEYKAGGFHGRTRSLVWRDGEDEEL